jgi:membrane-bound lytic murein transglycosylase
MAKKLYTVAVAVAVAEQEHEQTGERQESAALTRGRASERRRQLIQPIYRPLVQASSPRTPSLWEKIRESERAISDQKRAQR